jgi:hypothetical protein
MEGSRFAVWQFYELLNKRLPRITQDSTASRRNLWVWICGFTRRTPGSASVLA